MGLSKALAAGTVAALGIGTAMPSAAFAQETDKPAVNAQACVLYCVDDGKVYFSVNENKKMKINIKNVSLLDNKYFTHKNETFKKEVMTFNMIYEEEK